MEKLNKIKCHFALKILGSLVGIFVFVVATYSGISNSKDAKASVVNYVAEEDSSQNEEEETEIDDESGETEEQTEEENKDDEEQNNDQYCYFQTDGDQECEICEENGEVIYKECKEYEQENNEDYTEENDENYEENPDNKMDDREDQMEKDYKNWERNLKWMEKDLKRAEKIEERLIKEQEKFEKHAKKDKREIEFSYDDYVDWDLIEEVQLEVLDKFTNYKAHLDTLQEYIDNDDSEGFYNYTDTLWIFNLKSNTTNICLNSIDSSSWLIDLERYIAEYVYEAGIASIEIDTNVTTLKESTDSLILESKQLCDDVDAIIEDNQTLFDEFLSLDMEERQDLRFDMQDIESQIWDLQDAMNEKFDDFSINDPWMIVDEAMQAIQFQREGQFIENEISYIKDDIATIKEIVLKIEEQDESEKNKLIAVDLLEILDEAELIVTEVEEALSSSEDQSDKENAFETLATLEEIGYEAEDLIMSLDESYLEKYLSDEEIKILLEGPEAKNNMQKFENIGVNTSLAKDLADKISEDDALKIIEILLKKIDITKFEELINTLKDNGESDQLQSILNVMNNVDDEEILQNYMDNKKAILEYLDDLGDDSDLRSVKALIEDYNFAGDFTDQVIEAIESYLASDRTEEDKEALEETLYDLRDEDINFKKQNGVISFTDVLENEWYYSSIESLKDERVFSGKANGEFDPAGNLTNAEILKVALISNDQAENLTEYPDAEHWAEQAGYVARAEELGIDFDTDLDDPATRGYVVYLLEAIANFEIEDYTTVGFDDVAPAHEFADNIEFARLNELVSGYDGTNNFGPDNNLNRAEAAKIVEKFMEFLK